MIQFEVEKNVRDIFKNFKQGYTSIMGLISYIDLLSFLLKHKIINTVNKEHIYLGISEQLLKILEDESDRYEAKLDSINNY